MDARVGVYCRQTLFPISAIGGGDERLEADTESLWHVQLASGEVRVVTLDQLDEAYQEGVVGDDNYVWEDGAGADSWQTLGECSVRAKKTRPRRPPPTNRNPIVRATRAAGRPRPASPAPSRSREHECVAARGCRAELRAAALE